MRADAPPAPRIGHDRGGAEGAFERVPRPFDLDPGAAVGAGHIADLLALCVIAGAGEGAIEIMLMQRSARAGIADLLAIAAVIAHEKPLGGIEAQIRAARLAGEAVLFLRCDWHFAGPCC